MSAYGVGEGDIRNCLGKLNDPGKPALRRPGILPQQLRTSPLFARAESDPFGTGAFGLERRGKGYLIRSALNDGGKPEVSLEIGDAA